jgi:hypothetical protein
MALLRATALLVAALLLACPAHGADAVDGASEEVILLIPKLMARRSRGTSNAPLLLSFEGLPEDLANNSSLLMGVMLLPSYLQKGTETGVHMGVPPRGFGDVPPPGTLARLPHSVIAQLGYSAAPAPGPLRRRAVPLQRSMARGNGRG